MYATRLIDIIYLMGKRSAQPAPVKHISKITVSQKKQNPAPKPSKKIKKITSSPTASKSKVKPGKKVDKKTIRLAIKPAKLPVPPAVRPVK
jgi:hypothetical protein